MTSAVAALLGVQFGAVLFSGGRSVAAGVIAAMILLAEAALAGFDALDMLPWQ